MRQKDIAKVIEQFVGKWVMVTRTDATVQDLTSYECFDVRPSNNGVTMYLIDGEQLHIVPTRVAVNSIESAELKIQIGWDLPWMFANMKQGVPFDARWKALAAYLVSRIPKSCKKFADEQCWTDNGPNNPSILAGELFTWACNMRSMGCVGSYAFDKNRVAELGFTNFTHLVNSLYTLGKAWKDHIRFKIIQHKARGKITEVNLVFYVDGIEQEMLIQILAR